MRRTDRQRGLLADGVPGAAVDAALEAGKLLRAEFHRPGGPRGSGGHAEVDEEAERVIREKILAAFPAAYRGEESGTASGADTEHIWLVDPNDGTSAYLKGWRGSAVSIALVRKGVLVLGVVYAPTYPDDNGDLFAWAEGCGPVTRNGKPVTIDLADRDLNGGDDVPAIVFISQDADKSPAANAACAAPARFIAMPSIAYVLPHAFDKSERNIAGEVAQTTIDSLGLKVDQAFGYWFDFGDDWWHQINVVDIEDKVPKGKYPKVTKRVGKSPPQYMDE